MWVFVLLVVVGACALALRRRSAPAGPMPPSYPGALPLIGHGHLFGSGNSVDLWNLTKHMSETVLLWGGVMGFKLGPKQAYLISDPDDCLTVANSCLEKDFIYDFMKPALGNGLLTAEVPIWKVHRKLVTPAFGQAILDGFLGTFNSQSRKLVATLDQESGGKPFNSWIHLGLNGLETVCLTAMGGATADPNLADRFGQAKELYNHAVIERFKKFWLYNDFIYKLSSVSKKLENASKIVHDLSDSVLQSKKSNLDKCKTNVNENSGAKFKTFLDLLIEYSGEKGLFTDQEIKDEMYTMIVAGHDTTSTTIMYTLIMLGSHPEVQERVLKEAEEVVGLDRDVEKQDLPKLVYLEAVVKETMRLYPITPFVVRNVKESLKLKKYTLPAGSGAYLSIYAVLRHEMWGADAAQFLPERWLDRARVPTHQAAFASFSFGRRMCLGKTYALMSMKTTMVHIIRNFRFKADASKLQLKLEMLVKPQSGHYITMERRT